MKQKTYNTIWRWHFYAGLLIFPVLFIMAVTGGMYLLQPQIEDALYGDRLYLEHPYEGTINHDALITAAAGHFNAVKIHSYQPPASANETAQIMLTGKDEKKITAFMHPETAGIVGTVNETWRPMNIAKAIHGGLMMGTPGEIIVELVACWTLVLVITGLYLWWPRKNRDRGTLWPKLGHKTIKLWDRKFWRELHAVPGAWAGIWIMAIILTGLPWSVVWGDAFSKAGHAVNEGFPTAIFSERPHSTSDLSLPDIPVNALMDKISTLDIRHDFKIDYPWFPNGVFAVMPLRHGGSHTDAAYVFLDKRTGETLKDIRWDNLGAFGRASSIGVQFHEGRLFGPVNQIMNLLAVIILIGLSLTGPVMWWKRKPAKGLGAPNKPENMRYPAGLIILIAGLALFLPLFGLSVLTILTGEILYERWRRGTG